MILSWQNRRKIRYEAWTSSALYTTFLRCLSILVSSCSAALYKHLQMETSWRMWREWVTPAERQFILASLILVSASTILGLYVPKLAGQFLDRISHDDDEGALMALIACISVQQCTYGLAIVCLSFIGERAALRLRNASRRWRRARPV